MFDREVGARMWHGHDPRGPFPSGFIQVLLSLRPILGRQTRALIRGSTANSRDAGGIAAAFILALGPESLVGAQGAFGVERGVDALADELRVDV
ncbi:hypothetical protein, partial [Gymnodinialimonas sp.]